MTDGILNILKPIGMTSHDVVSFVRRTLHTKKVGHAGTLDPDAAGVLPVFVGSATRLLEYAVEGRKCYRAELTFGIKTDSGDDSGNIIARSSVRKLEQKELEDVLKKFTGELLQVPPMYSALKHEGKKLYQLAREGIVVEREPRAIVIYKLGLVDFAENSIILDVECSKGTYIRTLVEDIAEALGMCGTMSFLLRKSVAEFTLDNAVTLEELVLTPESYLAPVEDAVNHIPELLLTDNQALRISQGVKTTVLGVIDGIYRLKTIKGYFIGLGIAKEEKVQAEKIINPFTPTTWGGIDGNNT